MAFDLDRFREAQAPVYLTVLAELRAGRKTSHWMWFVFPQVKGLGTSEMAHHFGLEGLAEATAYLDHPILGPRLRECTAVVNGLGPATTVVDVFGLPDTLKFRSCMTLFELAAPPPSEFSQALDRYFNGERDARTLALVDSRPDSSRN